MTLTLRDYTVRVHLVTFGQAETRDLHVREANQREAIRAIRRAGYRSILGAWRTVFDSPVSAREVPPLGARAHQAAERQPQRAAR